MKRIWVVLISLIFLTACAGQSSTETPKTATKPSVSKTDTAAPANLPDPRSLTGLSTVPDIADPTPIGKFTPKLPVSVTDTAGTTHNITDVSRILALDITGTLSRTVIALGQGDNLVGRSVSSTENMLADLPVVTQQGHNLNVEAVLELRPTLILADQTVGTPENLAQLQNAGIPVVLTEAQHTLENNSEHMKFVAQVLGVPEAGEKLAKRVDDEIAKVQKEIAAWIPSEPLKIAFLYVRGTAGVFFILGAEYGTTSLIESLGAQDVSALAGITSMVPANAEALLAVNPEVIFTMTGGLESTDGLTGLLQRPGVADTIAGQNQRVVAIPDGISLSYGPQTAEILRNIAMALYGVEESK